MLTVGVPVNYKSTTAILQEEGIKPFLYQPNVEIGKVIVRTVATQVCYCVIHSQHNSFPMLVPRFLSDTTNKHIINM